MNDKSEDQWRNYPPARSDWRELEGDEYRAYYLQRQREACRFILDLDR